MNLEKLYKMQSKLDEHILNNHNLEMTPEELFNNTKLALLVELGELANTTRCFKHWSTKGKMEDEVVLDELADVWHFYLSLGNQVGKQLLNYTIYDNSKNSLTKIFNKAYARVGFLDFTDDVANDFWYSDIGHQLYAMAMQLNFTAEKVEEAYLKKHEENYQRQKEGY